MTNRVIRAIFLLYQTSACMIHRRLQSTCQIKQRKAMSLINTQVTPFEATAYHNGKFVRVTDENFKGKWSVVVFYPADFTFVCPTELGDLADHHEEFKRLGVEIYGVSTDTHFTHKAWHDTSDTIKKVKYPLIGDPSQQLARAFQVLIEEGEDAGL